MKNLERPRFSIVIPCYNEANYISDTLRSLEKQTTTETFEIIVVDNNCTDETVDIARSRGAKIVTESRPGVCWARQAGTEAATGEIIISTDADTKFSKNWLSNIDKTFRQDENIVAVGGPCRYFNGPWWGKIYTHFLFSGVYVYSLLAGRPFYMTATNIAFKKSAWTQYDVNLVQGGDELGLLHRLTKVGKVKFNNMNPTYTSGRRLTQGLFYNIFVTFFYYYLGAYYINKLYGREVISSAPAFRKKSTSFISSSISYFMTTLGIMVFALTISFAPLRSFISDQFYDAAIAVKDEIKEIS